MKSLKLTMILLMLLVIQLHSQISIMWSTNYNVDVDDVAHFVSPTFDKGCIITGVANGYDMTVDLFLQKLGPNGEVEWTRVLGSKSTQERGYCVRQTSDSCFIVTGYIAMNHKYYIYLLKLNSIGDTLWSKTYGTGVGGSVIETHDKCFLLAADKDTLNERYPTLIKTDSKGNVLWSNLYNISEPITYSVMEMSNGNFIVGCQGFSSSEQKMAEMLCVDNSGNLKWQRYNEKLVRIKSTIDLLDGTIVGVGSISRGFQGSNLRIVKTDTSGNTLSEREYGMGEYTNSEGTGVEILDSGKLVIAAKSNGYGDVISNFWAWLLEIDLNGDTLWTKIINNTGTNTSAGEFNSLGKLEVGEYYTAGRFFDPTKPYNSDFWIMKFRVDTTISGIDFGGKSEAIQLHELNQNYPNPFNPSTTISFDLSSREFVTLKVFNSIGEEIFTLVSQELPPGHYSREFDGSEYPSGVYYYRLQAGALTGTKKFVLLK